MNRAIGIVRVSRTAGREGERFHSPEEQRERIKATCKRENLEIVGWREELDVSGGKPLAKRDGLRSAVEDIEAGKANVLVAAYFDRLFRSLVTQAEVIERVERAGGRVLAVDVGHVTNGSAAQWLSGTMLGAVADYYRRSVGERLGATQVRAISQGKAPFRTPLGYRRRKDGTSEPDPDKAPLVRQAFQMRAEGKSYAAISKWLGEHGVKMSVPGVRKMMASRFYLGELRYREKLAEPNLTSHKAIVDVELFDRVQSTKGAPRGRRPTTDGLLSRLGVLRCRGCEGRMSLSRYSGRAQPFYRCVTPGCEAGAAIMAHVVEPMVIEKVIELCEGMEGTADLSQRIAQASVDLATAQAACDAAVEAFTGLDGPAATQKLQALREARDAAQMTYNGLMGTHGMVGIAVTAKAVFERGTLEEQRELISAVIDTVWVRQGRTKAERAERVEVVGKTL